MLRKAEKEIMRAFVGLSFSLLQMRKNQPPEKDWFFLFHFMFVA